MRDAGLERELQTSSGSKKSLLDTEAVLDQEVRLAEAFGDDGLEQLLAGRDVRQRLGSDDGVGVARVRCFFDGLDDCEDSCD